MEISLSKILPIVATFFASLAGLASILALYINNSTAKKIQKLKNESSKEIEYLKNELIKSEKIENIRQKYSIPLIKTAEELHNKLNDIVKDHERVLKYFADLTTRLSAIKSMENILKSATNIYVTNIFYLFARYFAIIEIIKKEFGLLKLASDEETKSFYKYARSTVAVFFSNSLFKKLSIDNTDEIKFQGKILEGAQTLLGESILSQTNDRFQIMSYYEFCRKITTDEDFINCFDPLKVFFENLKFVPDIETTSEKVDFRWAKILFFAYFLRLLVEKVDNTNAITLLPEIIIEEKKYFKKNQILNENLEQFKKRYWHSV